MLSPDGETTYIYLSWDGGMPDYAIPRASTPTLNFGPDLGGTWLAIDSIYGSPIPNAGLSFTGQPGQFNFIPVFIAFNTGDQISYTASQVTLNGKTFSYSNCSQLELGMRGGSATITQVEQSGADVVLGGTNDTFNVNAGNYSFGRTRLMASRV